MRHARMISTGSYIPERIMTNADFDQLLGEPVESRGMIFFRGAAPLGGLRQADVDREASGGVEFARNDAARTEHRRLLRRLDRFAARLLKVVRHDIKM